MTYATRRDEIVRTPIFLVTITLDKCDRVFGTSPCLASGTKCYNTRPTCIYTTAFLNSAGVTLRFTNADVPTPFNNGERPYLDDIQFVPTEITEFSTATGRVTVRMIDEPDDDVGMDPYVSTRSSVQGTFWRKLLARNPNYIDRILRIYEGFAGEPESEFQQRFAGKVKSIILSGGKAEIEAADYMADLASIYYPAKVDLRLRLAAASADFWICVTDISLCEQPSGYVRIDDEILSYSDVNIAGNTLIGVSRALFGTTAAAHSEGAKVQPCGYFGPAMANQNLYVLFYRLGLLTIVDWPILSQLHNAPNLDLPQTMAIISKPEKVSDLAFELLWHADAVGCMGEASMIQFARKVPNLAGRSVAEINDAGSIVEDSLSVTLKEEERVTRLELYWDAKAVGDAEEPATYGKRDLAIDSDAEATAYYGAQKPETHFSRWFKTGVESDEWAYQAKVANFLLRQLQRRRDAAPEFSFAVERKDADIATGSFVRITTHELCGIDGLDVTADCMITKRERDTRQGARLTALRMAPRKIAYVAPDATPDFASASASDKQYGFISNASPNEGKMPDGTDGYYIA